MSKEEIIGKEFNLDLGSLSPVSMIVRDITDDKVIVEYLHSTPGRIEEFSISDFEYFAMIQLNQNKEDEKLSMSSPCKDFSFTVPFEQSNVITDVKITMNTKNGVCKELNIPIEWDNINQNKDD